MESIRRRRVTVCDRDSFTSWFYRRFYFYPSRHKLLLFKYNELDNFQTLLDTPVCKTGKSRYFMCVRVCWFIILQTNVSALFFFGEGAKRVKRRMECMECMA